MARTLVAGSKLADFEIVAKLREGGMASFYLARRVGPAGFTKPVGIKVVHEHLASERALVDMFLDEARLCARIAHPNVVHVEELGEFEGMFFLAMEYVHGASLSRLMNRLASSRRRLSPEIACAIVQRAADGLHAAHEAKDAGDRPLEVVHRDVSPQNILLSTHGHVKLIDFGVAKSQVRGVGRESRLLRGKIAYMAPEQAWGRPVDRRTDVYALGIVAWELLTGRRLFSGSSETELLERVRHPEVAAPSAFDDAIETALDRVVLTALGLVPEERFTSALSFRRAIADACPGAASVEPYTLGVLLETQLADEMSHERALLSGTFAASVVASPAPDEEVARRSTTLVGQGDARADAEHPLPDPGDARSESDAFERTLDGAWVAEHEYPPRDALVPGRPPRVVRGAHVLAALSIAGVLGGAGALWYTIERAVPRDPRAIVEQPNDPTLKSDPPMCKGVPRFTPRAETLSSYGVDTRTDSSAEATRWLDLGRARNLGAAHAPTALVEVVVPGSGLQRLEFSTINGGTDDYFDTLIGVYPAPCSEILSSEELSTFDDPAEGTTERRSTGSLLAIGGDVLTFVLTAYGGGGPLDEGPIQMDMIARPVDPSALAQSAERL
jgi:serine/threonine-protein kinase